jgi:hypothetical protein
MQPHTIPSCVPVEEADVSFIFAVPDRFIMRLSQSQYSCDGHASKPDLAAIWNSPETTGYDALSSWFLQLRRSQADPSQARPEWDRRASVAKG